MYGQRDLATSGPLTMWGVPGSFAFGAEDAAPSEGPDDGGQADAQAAGGGGGGGGAETALGVVGAIAGATGMIINGIAMAVQQQSQPDIMAKRHATRFNRMLGDLERIDAEQEAAREKIRESGAWLRSSANRKQWMSGSAARTAAPAGSRYCEELYEDHPAGRRESPGGHVWGDTNCRCKTAACAYKDPAKAQWHKDRIVRLKRSLESGDLYRRYTNKREELQRSWGFLMGIMAFEPLLLHAPEGSTAANALMWARGATVNLLAPRTLQLIFPAQANAVAAEEASRGVVPYSTRDDLLRLWFNIYTTYRAAWPQLGLLIPPGWMYGLTPEQQQQYGNAIPPLVTAYAVSQHNFLPPGFAGAFGAAFGGRGEGFLWDGFVHPGFEDLGTNFPPLLDQSFGAAPSDDGFSAKIRTLLLAGANLSGPVPDPDTGIPLDQASPSQEIVVDDPKRRSKGKKGKKGNGGSSKRDQLRDRRRRLREERQNKPKPAPPPAPGTVQIPVDMATATVAQDYATQGQDYLGPSSVAPPGRGLLIAGVVAGVGMVGGIGYAIYRSSAS